MLSVNSSEHTLSKAVEQARGWVATKIGLFDIFGTFGMYQGSLSFFLARQAISQDEQAVRWMDLLDKTRTIPR